MYIFKCSCMKKAIVFVCVFVFGSVLALEPSYTDYAQILAEEGIIAKREQLEKYRVHDYVWRQEVIGMAVNMNTDINLDAFACSGVYNDITTATPNTWICRAAEAAAHYGILSRGEKYPLEKIGVKPERNITRAEALAMIWDALGIERADESIIQKYTYSSDTVVWQKRLLAAAYERDVIKDTASFGPNIDATRGEIFKIIAKLK